MEEEDLSDILDIIGQRRSTMHPVSRDALFPSSTSSSSSSSSSSSFYYSEPSFVDFDLNLLDCEIPSLEVEESLPSLNLDCQVPSPSHNLELSTEVLSPTMFSPGNGIKSKTRTTPYQRRTMIHDPSSIAGSTISDALAEFRQFQGTLVPNQELEEEEEEGGGGGGGEDDDDEKIVKVKVEDNTPLLCLSVKTNQVEPMISMAMAQVRKEIETACEILNISDDPCQWTKDDVSRWLMWTMQQYKIHSEERFSCDGQEFVQLTEADFLSKFPQGGDKLYAQMDIWRSTAGQPSVELLPPPEPFNVPLLEPSRSFNKSEFDISSVLQMLDHDEGRDVVPENINLDNEDHSTFPHISILSPSENNVTIHSPEPPPPYSVAVAQSRRMDEDEAETDDTEDDDEGSKIMSKSTSSSNIHLWQFVKELLLKPQMYSGCIHWIDRQKGIFKIVDSVQVATLWGQRKNRPAMNYDKLSRSLRQYYKKGIMKKTERSQRLVYQFCPPYHL